MPIRIITTGDMHGWIAAQESEDYVIGGTAQMLAYWKKHEGYRPDKFLLISTGDNVTGPDISTAFKGDPAIAVMNLMGYDVSAVGNHEFDFTVQKLIDWTKNADFPFVVANLVNQDFSQVEFAKPYVMNSEQGVDIAIIGLTPADLHESTNNAKDYRLISYTDAVSLAAKRARDAGAKVIVVAAHVPQDELIELAEEVKDLNIPLMIGGHSHELAQRKVGETWVVNSGQWWDYYTRIDMDYNPKSGKTTVLSSKQVYLAQYNPKSERKVKREVDSWKKRMAAEFGAVLGHTNTGLVRIPQLYNLVADTYAAFDSEVDFGLINYGALRQDWPAGQITKGDILSLMPFTNTLLKVKLTGAQLIEFIVGADRLGVSGLIAKDGSVTVAKTGASPEPDKTYTILIPNFLYDTSSVLLESDPNPVQVSDDWREPVYQWLQKNQTSKEKPLEGLVDTSDRS